jgi:hypothetical protein
MALNTKTGVLKSLSSTSADRQGRFSIDHLSRFGNVSLMPCKFFVVENGTFESNNVKT